MFSFFKRPFQIGFTCLSALALRRYSQTANFPFKKYTPFRYVKAWGWRSWFPCFQITGPNSFQKITEPNSFTYGVCNIPHPKKAKKGGEDAYYANNQILCVADGVGSWNNYGIDPAQYSKELVENVGKLFKEDTNKYMSDPTLLIDHAVKKATKFGSSTIAIISVDDKKSVLYGSNLGDSGYLIFRFKDDGNVVLHFQSKVQQHFFNCPYQAMYFKWRGYYLWNGRPMDYCHENIKHNDIILLASDGVLDNLYTKDLIRLIQKQTLAKLQTAEQMHKLAKIIADESFRLSQKKDYYSPFQKSAEECTSNQEWRTSSPHHKPNHKGGKEDDITVVISRVNITSQLK